MYIRTFIALFFISQAIWGFLPNGNKNDNFSLIHLESASTAIIDGCVNAITGEFFQATKDIEIAGTEPLHLERYLAQNLHFNYGVHSWHDFGFNFASKLNPGYNSALREGNGAIIYLDKMKKDKNGKQAFNIQSDHVKIGVTNCSGDIVGRKNHLRYLKVKTKNKDKNGSVKYPDGTVRYYETLKEKGLEKDYLFPVKECMPSGASHEYKYTPEYGISKISLKAKNNEKLGDIRFIYPSTNSLMTNPYFDVIGSNGQSVRYHLEKTKKDVLFKINKVEKSHAPTEVIKYKYTDKNHLEKIRVRRPESRYRDTILYHYGKQMTRKGSKKIEKGGELGQEMLVGRVHKLRAPVGVDDSPVNTYEFDYWTVMEYHVVTKVTTIVRGHTTVYDAFGYKTCYYFNNCFQLDKIEKYTGKSKNTHALYSTEYFRYDKAGQLTLRYFDKAGVGILFCHQFTYNEHGDPIAESLWGNLTGKEVNKTVALVNGVPTHNGVDVYTKKYQYTTDRFHNISHETDGYRETFYEYLHDTDTLSAKFTGPVGSIESREFYQYSGRGELVAIIADDGYSRKLEDLAGVTCRKIERREYANNFPTKIEVTFLDLATGGELLQSRKITRYSLTGKPLEEQFYDSNGDHLYTLRKEYDLHDNLTLATDPLGVITTYSYDANDNLVAEFREGVEKRNTYDFVNRLIKEEIFGSDGYQSLSCRYDHRNQKTADIDAWGRETGYRYDAFGRVKSEHLPAILSSDQSVLTPVILREYDSFGNVTKLTTATGYELNASYNIKGDLIYSVDADGMLQRCEYSPNGRLLKKIERSGLETHYTYDFMGRILSESLYDAAGQYIRGTRTSYKGPFKVSEVDTAGLETTYTYDSRGQCCKKTTGSAITYYTYDAQGRVIVEQLEDNIKTFKYDLFNRIVEETVDGRIARKIYDAHGRVIEEQQGESITLTEYNAISLPVRITDAEGRVTVISYQDDYINSIGQRVRLTTQTHPNGTQTETEYNAFGEIARQSTRSPYGELLQESRHYYNLNNKLCETVATVIARNKAPYERKVTYHYDPQGRLICLKDGAGSEVEKTTSYSYNLLGQKIAEKQANGIVLEYTYDLLGRVSSIRSSDGTIDYVYTYDRLDQLLHVQDLVNGTTNEKEYDPQGHLIKEKLANNLTLAYAYDNVGRLTSMIFPDESIATYTYNGTLLASVSYGENTHTYIERNASGKPLIERLSNGKLRTTSYAPGGQKLHVEVSGEDTGFSDRVNSRDLSGNVCSRTCRNRDFSYGWDDLHQLTHENDQGYSHDSVYNRTSKGSNEYSLNMLNQVVSDGLRSYHYDLNGNMVEGRGMSMTYDGLNRLISVTTPQGTTHYTYDHENRRMSASTEGDSAAPVSYFYFGMNELGSISATSTSLRVFGESEGAERGAGVLLKIDGIDYVPIYDLVGNIAQLEDLSGSVIEEYTCDVFGVESNEQGNSLTSPWRFSSKRVDTETGFVYFGHRYYDPTLGRWITADPQGYSAGPNLYAYVMNNPVTLMDQYGLIAEKPWNKSRSRSPEESQKRMRCGKQRFLYGAFRGYISTPVAKEDSESGSTPNCGKVRFNQAEITNRDILHHELGIKDVIHKFFLVFLNGINNTLEEAKASAGLISKAFKGLKSYLLYNETKGFVIDVLDAGLLMGNHYSSTCETIEAGIMQLCDMHPDKQALVICHSKGALIFDRVLDRLPIEYRKRMHVFTFGGAAVIKPGRGILGCMNYISSRDAVPHGCSFLKVLSHRLGWKKDYIEVLKGRGFYGLDHSFDSPTYQNALQDIAKQFERLSSIQ